MPKLTIKRLSVDTETTGVDIRHGCGVFLVTLCGGYLNGGKPIYWEWRVDPVTRMPVVVLEDLDEIQEHIDDATELVLQNPKFDQLGLRLLFERAGKTLRWNWVKVRDTLLAGHLLASNQPHDLTTMALTYLGVNIQPYEDACKVACTDARRIATAKYPDWLIAKPGLPTMPSIKKGAKQVWKNDLWLPREVAIAEGYFQAVTPTVVNRKNNRFTLSVGRDSKWGNPFVIGRDGTREEVISKHLDWIQTQPELLASLNELSGQVLGCYCEPLPCHGNNLVKLFDERVVSHPWHTVTSDYANTDSEVTGPLYDRQLELIKQRSLLKIYRERLKILPLVASTEDHGVTVHAGRLNALEEKFTKESARSGRICTNVAKSYGHDLVLPKSGNNNSLKSFCFDVLKLPVVGYTDGGSPSLDKEAIENYVDTLPERSKPQLFIRELRNKRKADTLLQYAVGYRGYWIPTGVLNDRGEQLWYRLHPSLNPTGTATLRWSSSNPNEQNISKQDGYNLREAFGPGPGREWWSCDAKNIELRLPAYEAGEDEMIALFERPNDPPYFGSVHLLMFDTLHPEVLRLDGLEEFKKVKEKYESTWYQWTKNGDFAVQYGAMEESGTADRAYHVPGGQRKIQSRFKKIAKLNLKQISIAEERGYVETMPDKDVDPDRGYPLLCSRSDYGRIIPTVPLNYHVQGTAMWWMMMAQIRCYEYLEEISSNRGEAYFIAMQVHDELMFDFPKRGEPTLVKSGREVEDNTNIPVIRQCMKLMERGGEGIGVPTPVSCKYHPIHWAEGISV